MRENITRTEQEASRERARGFTPYMPNEFALLRLFKIMFEFMAGFQLLKKYCLAATFFGSARTGFNDKVYRDAEELAKRLAKDGFTVISGGAAGVMEAANKGAKEGGGESIGLNIELPHEQSENDYTTSSYRFHYFFIRKVMLSFASEVYIFFPGGFGTLDEFFEIVTLIQTGKIQQIPVILIDRSYWTPLLSWIESELYEKNKAVDKSDMRIYELVDSVEEAHELIRRILPIERLKVC